MKPIHMDDGDKQIKAINITKRQKDNVTERFEFIPSIIFQSFWVRCRTIFPDITNGKFMESELRFVLRCGIFFWMLYLLFEATK